MTLENIVAFGGRKIDIKVSRKANKIYVVVISDGKNIKSSLVNNGTKIDIRL